ncbi:MAG TPA: zinc-dependent metalloprotease [Thermomicrobiales bacterium]|nr:zinc-dependent metalloprotease [Thermomicrobiales bacterium]
MRKLNAKETRFLADIRNDTTLLTMERTIMPVAPPPGDRIRRAPDRRILAASVLLAAAAGAWAGQRLQEPARARAQSEESPPLINWRAARDIAVTMSRDEALSMAERKKLDAEYRALVTRCVPIVSDYTGDLLPDAPERTFAFDRVDWVNANIDSFERMFAPLEGLNLLGNAATRSIAGQMFGTLNQKILSAEIGLLLGYLARKVLGQYDLTLLGREPMAPGRLYYVEPNIKAAERTLELPREDFRMWLALHETTHAFEFEAHPWVRDHFNSMLERYFTFLREDAEALRSRGFGGLRLYLDRVRMGPGESGSWLEALMNAEQRTLFSQMQAMMCIVEGYSNHVMNVVGRDLLPNYTLISRRFAQRQQQRSQADQLLAKLTGLDVKMEQYRLGEQFIDFVVRERGHGFARRVWDGADYLPTMAEIRQPEFWLARIDHRDGRIPAPPSVVAAG